jgi:hypothetical protein
MALLSPRGAQVGQEGRTMSNCCIKEMKEVRRMRGPMGAWKGPYLDPKGAFCGPQRFPQGAPSGYLGPQLGLLAGPVANFRGP